MPATHCRCVSGGDCPFGRMNLNHWEKWVQSDCSGDVVPIESYRSASNPQEIHPRPLHSLKLTLWYAVVIIFFGNLSLECKASNVRRHTAVYCTGLYGMFGDIMWAVAIAITIFVGVWFLHLNNEDIWSLMCIITRNLNS